MSATAAVLAAPGLPGQGRGASVDYVTINGAQIPLRATQDDGPGRWYIYPPTGQNLASFSYIKAETTGEYHLRNWYAKMAARAVLDNLDVYQQVIAEGNKVKPGQGFLDAVELAKGEGERVRLVKADTGSFVHAWVEQLIIWSVLQGIDATQVILPELAPHLRGIDYDEGMPLDGVAEWMIDGFTNFVAEFGARFGAAEMTVYNVGLGVAGTLDFILILHNVAISRGTGPLGEDELVWSPGSELRLCVDVKTGKHTSVSWHDQITCYADMTECLMPDGSILPMPPTDGTAVLHLRPEYVHGFRLILTSEADAAAARERFSLARQLFHKREAASKRLGPVVYMPGPDGVPPRLVADLEGYGYPRVIGPITTSLGRTVTVAQLADFTEKELLSVKGIGDKTVVTVGRMLADHGMAFKPDSADQRKAA